MAGPHGFCRLDTVPCDDGDGSRERADDNVAVGALSHYRQRWAALVGGDLFKNFSQTHGYGQ